jgi:hypothetical protein
MELAESSKIQTTEGVNIPAFSIRHIPIVSPSGAETQLFTPSRRLMLNKALTVGHALLPANTTTVPIANISCREVWLDKGSTLGTTQKYSKQVISCDLNGAVPLPAVSESTLEIYKINLQPNRISCYLKDAVQQRTLLLDKKP